MTDKIKIGLWSDIHCEFEYADPPVGPPGFDLTSDDIDLMLMAGDISKKLRAAPWVKGWAGKHNIPTVWITGNHDFWGSRINKTIDKARETCADSELVHFLENELWVSEVRGRKIRVLGCTLWTDYELHGTPRASKISASDGLNDHRKITDDSSGYTKFRPEHAQRMHMVSRKWLRDELTKPFDGATVVMTHHGPHPNSVSSGYKRDSLTPAYTSDLTEILEAYDIDLWVHGHMHRSFDYEVAGTRIVCNPYGYFGEEVNPRFDVNMILEV